MNSAIADGVSLVALLLYRKQGSVPCVVCLFFTLIFFFMHSRKTKIVATLGPASDTQEQIEALILAGVNVTRLNFSHGKHEEHKLRYDRVRKAAKRLDRNVGILMDLQGPKIRLGLIENDKFEVEQGHKIEISRTEIPLGNAQRIFIKDYPTLGEDLDEGGVILIDDGKMRLRVDKIDPETIYCTCENAGELMSRKGVNLPNIRNNTPSLTEKDLIDLAFGLEMGVDFVALSFVRTAEDVIDLKERIAKAGKHAKVISKIEKPEAVKDIDRIIEVSDAIMVARGDLGIETPMENLPVIQKTIIRKCLDAAKPVITATQMLESMRESPIPTRAEASDVANAVLDGTDAVMLSAETASGLYPLESVTAMADIIEAAEAIPDFIVRAHEADLEKESITESIGWMASILAKRVDARFIVCMTHSGATAKLIARHRPEVPIWAFTDNKTIENELSLLWGTYAHQIPFQASTDAGILLIQKTLKAAGMVDAGDRIIFTVGMPLPQMGSTNMIHVSTIPSE